MSLVDVILSRRSIRRYEKKKVPEEVLEKILEVGRQAPSADNMQPWHFIVVTDQDLKERLSTGKWNAFIKESAFTIVGCGYIGGPYGQEWSTIDTTIAMQNMVVAAWSLKVGSCWIGDFKEDKVKQLLNIPDNWKVVALITFGYPAEKPHPKRKKPIEKIVSFNKF